VEIVEETNSEGLKGKECGHMKGGGVFVFSVEVWKSWKEEGTNGGGIKFSIAKVVR
jgi:hypothetical protein